MEENNVGRSVTNGWIPSSISRERIYLWSSLKIHRDGGSPLDISASGNDGPQTIFMESRRLNISYLVRYLLPAAGPTFYPSVKQTLNFTFLTVV